jgi:transposase
MATKRYRRDLKGLELRRRKGMRMLARGVPQAEVARTLQVSRQTASSWAKKLAVDRQAWRRKPLGRPGGLDAAQKKQLGKALLAGAVANDFPTELWTLARVAKLIGREFGVAYSTVHVWRILRELGFSSQRPAGRAIQRDEAAIKRWRSKRWPALKKSPAAKAAPSSSSTKAD